MTIYRHGLRPALLLALAGAVLGSARPAPAQEAAAEITAPAPVADAENQVARSSDEIPAADRMAWFHRARFGMFIHWGLYAVPAGEWGENKGHGEWIQLTAKIPNAEYEKFAAEFNPERFDAEEWVKVAKAAGMKYIVITAKHHDGFCLYDTRQTDYNILKGTPYGRNPLKELAEATRAAGLTFCIYYSVPDWHHPEFPARYSQRGFHGDPNDEADLDKYVEYVKAQLRELLTNYGPIGILWFDNGGSFPGEHKPRMPELIRAEEILALIRELQPDCLVNNRLGLPADYGTPEQHIPGEAPTTAFEVCMTLNRHWGYNRADQNWKEPREVVHNLIDIASKGGNYLLNVGPTAEGVIPEESVRILAEVGQWMETNGDAIYGTRASSLEEVPEWGRVTRTDDRMYLHVFDWPADGELVVRGLRAKARDAWLLADEERASLQLSPRPGELVVRVPPEGADEIATVVVVEL